MKKYLAAILPYLVLVLLTVLALNVYFKTMIAHPSDYVMGLYGDAGKSYFTSEYFVRHDKGSTFSGMNYPYGMQIVFAENPGFLLATRWWSTHISSLEGKTHTILNIWLIFSFIPCVFFTFLILRKNNIAVWPSVLFAVLITFLNPQANRITHHLALGWLFFFPLTWYLLIRLFEPQERRRWLWGALLSITTGIMALIHLYYFLIIFLFVGGYIFVHFFQNISKYKKNIKTYYIPALAAVLVPIVLIRLWISATTLPGEEAVKVPYGFFTYWSNIRSIFLPPPENPVTEVLNTVHNINTDFSGEGYGYVGLVATVLGLFMLGRALRRLRKRQFRQVFRPALPGPLQVGIFAGLLLLIHSTVILFQIYEPMSFWIMEIRQFRSMGRLAWGFYFVFSIYTAFALYRQYRAISIFSGGKLKRLGTGILAVAILWWGIEANILMKKKSKESESTNLPLYNNFWLQDIAPQLLQAGIKPNDFQAILTLPYYNIGNEKFYTDASSGASPYSMAAAIFTGLPLVNNYSARTPLAQTCRNVQLFSDSLIHKTYIDSLRGDSRPLLLIYDTNATIPPVEWAIIKKAQPLFKYDGMRYCRLNLSAFRDCRDSIRATFAGLKATLTPYNGLLVQGNPAGVEWSGFGDGLWEKPGDAAQAVNLTNQLRSKAQKLLWEKAVNTAQPKQLMKMSIWIRIDGNDNYLPAVRIQELDKNTGAIIADADILPRGTLQIYNNWAEISFMLYIDQPGNTIRLSTADRCFTFDHLLLRPADVHVWQQHPDGRLVLDNHPLF